MLSEGGTGSGLVSIQRSPLQQGFHWPRLSGSAMPERFCDVPSASRRITWPSIAPETPTACGVGGLGIRPCSRHSTPINKGQDEEPSRPNAVAGLTMADVSSHHPHASMHTGAPIAVAPILGCTVHGTAIKGAVQDRVLTSPAPASRVVPSYPQQLPVFQVTSDASSHWGCGAWSEENWFQVPWDVNTLDLPITVKEILPILLVGVLWGRSWRDRQVVCHCDNQAIVACLHSRTSKYKGIMHLLWALVFIEAYNQFHLVPCYIDTRANHLADDLSRDCIVSFLSKHLCKHLHCQHLCRRFSSTSFWIRGRRGYPQWQDQFRAFLNKV